MEKEPYYRRWKDRYPDKVEMHRKLNKARTQAYRALADAHPMEYLVLMDTLLREQGLSLEDFPNLTDRYGVNENDNED